MKTILLAGLGNPGKKYEKTRHNAGFLFVDFFFGKFRDEFNFSDWEFKKNLNAEISIGKTKRERKTNKKQKLNFLAVAKKLSFGKKDEDEKIILMKPQAFMNLSGEAVRKAVKYYKVNLKNLIVVHDDIDFALGKYKISTGSRAAGHNGVQSVIDQLDTKDFNRIRIGIDNRGAPAFVPPSGTSAGKKKISTEKYVLGKFTEEEIKIVKKVISTAILSLS